MTTVRTSRNPSLVAGVSTLSRTASYRKRMLFKRKNATQKKQIQITEQPTVYPADDISLPKKSRKAVPVNKIRSTITPGTVLILLAGRFRGKRVVFLKQLESGLLLVTGPHKINGVPLRRVNQAYVIATSTKLDISKVKIDAKFSDAFFKHEKKTKEQLKEKPVISEQFVKDQKIIDSQIVPLVKKTPLLKAYLNASFALSKGQYPHAIKF